MTGNPMTDLLILFSDRAIPVQTFPVKTSTRINTRPAGTLTPRLNSESIYESMAYIHSTRQSAPVPVTNSAQPDYV